MATITSSAFLHGLGSAQGVRWRRGNAARRVTCKTMSGDNSVADGAERGGRERDGDRETKKTESCSPHELERAHDETRLIPSWAAGDSRSARREVLKGAMGLAAVAPLVHPGAAAALGFKKDLTPARKRNKVPEEAYKVMPNGIKYYDVKLGSGLEAKEGERVAIHYDCKWRGITFMTSRQGMGVTGGTPMGFDVGASGPGGTLKGLDLGIRGMRVGGQRKLKVPPEFGYGDKQIGEIPPNSTLDIDVELLSIKTSPMGYQVKLIEG